MRTVVALALRTQINLVIMERIQINRPDREALASRTYPYITREEGIRGGNPIIVGTRIGVHDVVGLLQNGEDIDSLIADSFPSLTKAQVYECLAYYEDHRGEIDLLIARQSDEIQ